MLQRLVDAGNTVLVIEHNLDVIKQADWIVDLGPEGGDAGGELIAAGTPEEVAEVEESYTGQFLRGLLPARRAAASPLIRSAFGRSFPGARAPRVPPAHPDRPSHGGFVRGRFARACARERVEGARAPGPPWLGGP